MTENKIFVSLAALFLLGMMSLFSVNETEKAIEFNLGQIVKDDYKPGIHFKLPWHNVKKFDSRIQTMNSEPEGFLTAEKKNVIVDSYVKWRIGNVKIFYTAVAGNVKEANSRLGEIIKDAFRSEFAKRDIKRLVSTDRTAIRDILIKNVTEISAKKYGLEIVDVRIKRIDLPPEVSNSVFLRMTAERARVARQFRSQGAEEAEQIRANADRQQVVAMANAFRDAEKLRGEGDAKAAEVYATAYGADTEFFAFYRSLNAYKNVFSDSNDMIVIEPNSDFFKYFKNPK
jgi:membrane protease subunit HflC